MRSNKTDAERCSLQNLIQTNLDYLKFNGEAWPYKQEVKSQF